MAEEEGKACIRRKVPGSEDLVQYVYVQTAAEALRNLLSVQGFGEGTLADDDEQKTLLAPSTRLKAGRTYIFIGKDDESKIMERSDEEKTDLIEKVLDAEFQSHFKRNKWIDKRTGSINIQEDGTVLDLGETFQMIERSQSARRFMLAVQGLRNRHRAALAGNLDKASEGSVYTAFISFPGGGKSACSTWVVPACLEDSDLRPTLEEMGLEEYFDNCHKYGLQFRHDYSEAKQLSRCAQEMPASGDQADSPRVVMSEEQSLAFRSLWLMCPGMKADLQELLDWLEKLPGAHWTEQDLSTDAGRYFVRKLQPHHVWNSVRRWSKVEGAVMIHEIWDEPQTLLGPEERAPPSRESNVRWFKRLNSAFSRAADKADVLVVRSMVSTRVETTSLDLTSASGKLMVEYIPLKLLSSEGLGQVALDFVRRVAGKVGEEVPMELHPYVKTLAAYAGGNPRHFEALLAASAALFDSRQIADRTNVQAKALVQVMKAGLEHQGRDSAVKLAIGLIKKRNSQAINKWLQDEFVPLYKDVVGKAILGTRVRRSDVVGMMGPRKITYGHLEEDGMLALQEVEPAPDAQPSAGSEEHLAIYIPFLTFHQWHAAAVEISLLQETGSSLLESFRHYLSAEEHELQDVGIVVLKLQILKKFLGRTECTLDELVPLSMEQRSKYKDLRIMVDVHFDITQMGFHTNVEDYRKMREAVIKSGKGRAYKGPGQEPRVDWWILLLTKERDATKEAGGNTGATRSQEAQADCSATRESLVSASGEVANAFQGGASVGNTNSDINVRASKAPAGEGTFASGMGLLELQGQSKKQDELGGLIKKDIVMQEYEKRFKELKKEPESRQLFLFVSDGKRMKEPYGEDIVVVGQQDHDKFYSPLGGMRRRAIGEAVQSSKRHKR